MNEQNLRKLEMGSQIARKHSDLVIAEVIALRQKYRIGYSQISYLTGMPRTSVIDYCLGRRCKPLVSSDEFQAKVEEIMNLMSKYPPASHKQVIETKAEMRKRLRKERDERLADEAISHVPVPTVAQIARARAEREAEERKAKVQETRAQDRHSKYEAIRLEQQARLKAAGVPASAPKHVIDRYR